MYLDNPPSLTTRPSATHPHDIVSVQPYFSRDRAAAIYPPAHGITHSLGDLCPVMCPEGTTTVEVLRGIASMERKSLASARTWFILISSYLSYHESWVSFDI